MASDYSVRFWKPAPDAATELLCASLEGSAGQPHVHEEWQFAVVETPSKLSLGAFQRYDAQMDDVTMVHPYDVHSEAAGAGGPSKWRMLYVASSMVSRLYGGKAPRFFRPVLTDPAAAAELRELLRQSEEGTVAGAEFLSRVSQWLEQLLLRHAEDAVTALPLPSVERARVYLQSHPTQSITLPEVGAVAGVTISHLVRSFSRRVGLPPRSYHSQVRLAHARRLLANGKSATWVAYECGFADQSHLSRRFKECHGVTPGAFQAQYTAGRIRVAAGEKNAA